jgi:hypothetical protein
MLFVFFMGGPAGLAVVAAAFFAFLPMSMNDRILEIFVLGKRQLKLVARISFDSRERIVIGATKYFKRLLRKLGIVRVTERR